MSPFDAHVNFKKTWTAEEFSLYAEHFFVKTEDGLNISAYEVAVDTPKVVIICLSAFSSWEDVFCDNMSLLAPKIMTSIEKPFVSLVTFLKFGTNSYSIKPKKEIEKLGNKLALLMHSKDDSQVPYRSFERLLEHAPSHVETFIRDGNSHFITKSFVNPKEDEEYTEKIIRFINNMNVGR